MFYSHDHCLVKTISAHEKTDIHMQINMETLKEEKKLRYSHRRNKLFQPSLNSKAKAENKLVNLNNQRQLSLQ